MCGEVSSLLLSVMFCWVMYASTVQYIFPDNIWGIVCLNVIDGYSSMVAMFRLMFSA